MLPAVFELKKLSEWHSEDPALIPPVMLSPTWGESAVRLGARMLMERCILEEAEPSDRALALMSMEVGQVAKLRSKGRRTEVV